MHSNPSAHVKMFAIQRSMYRIPWSALDVQFFHTNTGYKWSKVVSNHQQWESIALWLAKFPPQNQTVCILGKCCIPIKSSRISRQLCRNARKSMKMHSHRIDVNAPLTYQNMSFICAIFVNFQLTPRPF